MPWCAWWSRDRAGWASGGCPLPQLWLCSRMPWCAWGARDRAGSGRARWAGRECNHLSKFVAVKEEARLVP